MSFFRSFQKAGQIHVRRKMQLGFQFGSLGLALITVSPHAASANPPTHTRTNTQLANMPAGEAYRLAVRARVTDLSRHNVWLLENRQAESRPNEKLQLAGEDLQVELALKSDGTEKGILFRYRVLKRDDKGTTWLTLAQGTLAGEANAGPVRLLQGESQHGHLVDLEIQASHPSLGRYPGITPWSPHPPNPRPHRKTAPVAPASPTSSGRAI